MQNLKTKMKNDKVEFKMEDIRIHPCKSSFGFWIVILIFAF